MPSTSPKAPLSPPEHDHDHDHDPESQDNNVPGSAKKRKLSSGRTSQACSALRARMPSLISLTRAARCRSLKMKCIGANDPP